MDYLLFGAVILYLMIGVFFAELVHEPGSDFSSIPIFFWPLLIVLAILWVMIIIPTKLAEWVKKKF